MDPRFSTSDATVPRSGTPSSDAATMEGTIGAEGPLASLSQALVVCDTPLPLRQPHPTDSIHNQGERPLRRLAIQSDVGPAAFWRSHYKHQHM